MRTIRYICIIIIYIINILFSQDILYLIYTKSELLDAANNLSDLHMYDITEDMQLNTKII